MVVLLWHIYRFIVEVSSVFPYLKWGTPLGYVFYLGFYVLVFAALFLFVKLIDRASLYEIGLWKATRWQAYIMLGIVFAFSARFLEVLSFLFAGARITVLPYPSLPIVLFFIVDTLFVGLAEEGVFRGYIQRHLTHNHGFIKALLVSSILFKMYHLNFFEASLSDLASSFLVLPSFGLFAGYFYYKTEENLLGTIGFHMFYDLFGTIIPLEIQTGLLSTGMVSFLRILRWLLLMLTLKILADRKIMA